MSKKVFRIGHRGAKGYVAENTIASVKKALSQNVDGIEIEEHKCASGELVVFHDFTLDRLTNGSGEISKFTHNELKKLKVEGEFKIPTLNEVLDVIDKQCLVNVELKGKETPLESAIIIEEYVKHHNWKYDDFIVSSFQFDLLSKVFKANKNIPIGVLTDVSIEEAIVFAKTVNAVAIHPDYTMLTKANVKSMHEEKFKVYTWTVNKPKTIKRIESYNVNGIISDFPDRV